MRQAAEEVMPQTFNDQAVLAGFGSCPVATLVPASQLASLRFCIISNTVEDVCCFAVVTDACMLALDSSFDPSELAASFLQLADCFLLLVVC